jgi:hypothetical protein
LRKFTSLVKFSLPVSLAKGLVIGLRYNYLPFVCFKIVYDSAIWTSVFGSLLGRRRGRVGDLTDERDERDERDEKDGEDERE